MKISLRLTLLSRLFVTLFIITANPATAFSQSAVNPDAFVYILNMGINENQIEYKGLRNGFAVGDGQYVLTAAHCVQDFEISTRQLSQPLIISPYYGDIFEAAIVAIDEPNDIAILKPSWPAHPGLELETSAAWKKSKTLVITGYPPADACRGGNGSISLQTLSEQVNLQTTHGFARYAVQVGPARYPGPGWSGSPLIHPETGKVVSLLSNEKYIKKFFFLKQHLIFGPHLDTINRLFANSHLFYETSRQTLLPLHRQRQFEQILNSVNIFYSDMQKKAPSRFKELCRQRPDSYGISIITGWLSDSPEDSPYFQKAVEIAPNSAFAHAVCGFGFLKNQHYTDAADEFQRVIELDPNHLFACYGQLISLIQTAPNQAEQRALECIRRWPENAAFYFEYSRMLRIQQRYADELPIIQKAVERCDPVPFLYQRHLADSLRNNGRYAESEQAYQTLLKTHECEHCWRAYALLLEKMGPEKSQQALQANEKADSFKKDSTDTSADTVHTEMKH